MDVKNDIMRWLFFSVILPLSPFLFAILLSYSPIKLSGQPISADWSVIFTSAELLFLGMVVCASGIRDARELESYETSNLPTSLIFYSLLLGAFAAAILYADIIATRMRGITRIDNFGLSIALILVLIGVSLTMHVKLFKAKDNAFRRLLEKANKSS